MDYKLGKNPPFLFWTIANLLTLSRILLLPPLIWAMLSGQYYVSFLMIVLIGISDFLDGRVARQTNTTTTFGAIFDVCADCIVVFSLQGFLISIGKWPMYILILSLCAIISFLIPGRSGKTRSRPCLGKYTGAVLMIVFMGIILCWAFSPAVADRLWRVLCPGTAVFLCLVIFENINGKIRLEPAIEK